MKTFHTLCLGAAAFALWLPVTIAAPPPLRDQVSLNGVWEEGGNVPVYGGSVLDRQTYRRHVSVPADWSGGIIQLEFEDVNFVADVFVNQERVARHVGGWKPFAVDVTRFAAPGGSFDLKIDVLGMKHAPILDENERALWPVGAFYLDNRSGGIVDDVWLRAYGKVHVESAAVKTSWRCKEIEIEYVIRNRDDRTRTVKLHADVLSPAGEPTVKRMDTPGITLAPGKRQSVQVRRAWPEAETWWPDRPTLYHLETRLLDGGTIVDRETRRFGFREIWTEGNQYRLNGIRVNLWGEYATFGDPWFWPASAYAPEELPKTYATLKSLNERVLRWHRYPPPRYALDLADETGLMLVAESPLYGRGFYRDNDRELFLRNIESWMKTWIAHSRNHPSIVMWSAENEMILPFHDFTRADVARIRDFIVREDPTRPVVFHSDGRAEDGVVNYHYPERYNFNPKGSVYSWAHLVDPLHPSGVGEFLNPWTPKPGFEDVTGRNRWWMGVWMRGMRYVNIADFRPTIYQWACREMDSRRIANLRNAMASVALFDKAYDDLGIAPFTENALPALEAGAAVRRTLALFNDDYRDTAVTVEVELRTGGAVKTAATRTYDVPLGEHVDIPCSFQVPTGAAGSLELVLMTRKAGIKKFEEAKAFRIEGAAAAASGPGGIELGDPLPPTHMPPRNVKAAGGERAVTLTWDPAPGAVRYQVKRAKSAPGPYRAIAHTKAAAYADAGLEAGTEYHYAISAVNGALSASGEVESGDSAPAMARTKGPAPRPTIAITYPQTGQDVPTGFSTNITWTSKGNPGPVKIEFSHDGGVTWSTVGRSAQDGAEAVALPAMASANCRIRIRRENGPAVATTGNFRLGLVGQVTGELKTWHPVTITFDGPYTSENAEPNPFRNYRLNVTFSKGKKSCTVPGYYAADGRAGEYSSISGTKWRVHFVPDEAGEWTYQASFRSGPDVAMSMDPTAGAATAFNGAQGSFIVKPSDKSGPDHRGKGLLRYTGKHYLQFAGSKEYFIKGGSDSPETFLSYYGFDNTPGQHKYAPHARDWRPSDPSWQYDKGRNIIGALNYLSGKGANSLYFLTMNVHPDRPGSIWPWIGSDVHDRYDCSKLDQWEIVFSHMDRVGILLHVVLQERENDQMLDEGDLGPLRKLYHRELIGAPQGRGSPVGERPTWAVVGKAQ